jgi:hypothetical protein
MKLSHIDTSSMELAITRSKRHLPEIQNLLEEYKRLNIGNLTEPVFKAVISGNADELRPAWDKRVSEDIANITTNPQIAAKFKADADIPWMEFVSKVQKLKRERESASIGGTALESFYSIEKGKAAVNEEAIKEHYSVYMSDFGEALLEKAKTAKAALDELTAMLKAEDYDTEHHPVLMDTKPYNIGPYNKFSYDPMFFQRGGEIQLDEDFFDHI